MKLRKIISTIAIVTLLVSIFMVPTFAEKSTYSELDFSDPAHATTFSTEGGISSEISNRYDETSLRLYFGTDSADLWPQSNHWIDNSANDYSKCWVEIRFLVGDLGKLRELVGMPTDTLWWPWAGTVYFRENGDVTIGAFDDANPTVVPGGSALKAETWYTLTCVMDYTTHQYTAWIGDKPDKVDWTAMSKDNASGTKAAAFNMQVANAAQGGYDNKGIYIDYYNNGGYTDISDFNAPAAAPTTDTTDNTTTSSSPVTGDNSSFIFLTIALFALAGFVLLRKKANA